MKAPFCTLGVICFGDWLVKASSFDDQILIFFYNEATIEHHTKMFYCENKAFNYVEGLLNDSNFKINYR
jgi:hypothetical protein